MIRSVVAASVVAFLTLPVLPSAANAALERIRKLDPELAARVLALSPDHISEADVRDTLARVDAPRIILLEGSIAFVSMQPFAEFLSAMGYPEARLRDPRDSRLSRSSFDDSERLAGELAWYYEREGMMPMLIGHSQGGMLVIRTLYELAGDFHQAVPVFDPLAGRALERTTIRDPLTGATAAVIGLKVGYAAALATGKLARVLLGQWSMLPRLRLIPDTVEDFTGFTIPGDIIAGNVFGDEPYRASGTAHVRNVTLPQAYRHIDLPLTRHLAEQPVTRAWIDAYNPDSPASLPLPPADASNLLHAADVWFSVKKHWCIEAQRAIRAAKTAP
ncbi:MAG TPA: hypothetical protein VGL25_16445 [Casimicrobiaceae bacterium]